jgi:hypothetical protein
VVRPGARAHPVWDVGRQDSCRFGRGVVGAVSALVREMVSHSGDGAADSGLVVDACYQRLGRVLADVIAADSTGSVGVERSRPGLRGLCSGLEQRASLKAVEGMAGMHSAAMIAAHVSR